MTEREAYRILGLSPGTDDRELKRTYRKLIMQSHPDSGNEAACDRARELNLAYAILKGAKAPERERPFQNDFAKRRQADRTGWNAPLNIHAFAEREILCYAEDPDGAPLGSFSIARGKYLWRIEEDFPLFLLSVYRCGKDLLDEADAALHRNSPSGRERIQAELTYLLAQQFIDGAALLSQLAKKGPPDQSGEPVFYVPSTLEFSGPPIALEEDELLFPSVLRRHRLYLKRKSGKEIGYLSFPDDRLYYVVVPLLEQRRVRIRVQAAPRTPRPKKAAFPGYHRLHLWLKWNHRADALLPENLNLQIEKLLWHYRNPTAPF